MVHSYIPVRYISGLPIPNSDCKCPKSRLWMLSFALWYLGWRSAIDWKEIQWKVLLNEGQERENYPNFLQHFSFWCSDKNGKLMEEQNSVGCQYIQEKAKVHFCVQRRMPADQCFPVWSAEFILQLISSRTKQGLLWLPQQFAWIALGLYWGNM